MAYCTKCGAQVPEGDAFCTTCGQPLMTSSAKQEASKIPTFSPPAPTFTPPVAPTFTAPVTQSYYGPACYYHNDEQSIANCTRCGKNLCRDCFDVYRLDGGEYAGKAICYDCAQQLVAENVQILKGNKSKIITTFVLTIVGMIIGAIIGASTGSAVGVILGILIGGCFWTFLKGWFSRIGGALKGGGFNLVSFSVGFFLGFFIEAVLSIYRTIRKIIECIVYLVKTSRFIQEDTAALQQMRDYMEYTLVRNQNKGVDLETLMGQGSELYNNTYAQAIMANGEEAADAMLRRSATMIAENGEIIRSFAA